MVLPPCCDCGAPTGVEPEALVPLCPACCARRAAHETWELRRPDGTTIGPVGRASLAETWVRHRPDRLWSASRGGAGQWVPVTDDPDLREAWLPWTALAREIAEVDRRLRRAERARWRRRWLGRLFAAGLLGASGVLLQLGLTTNALVVPEPWVEAARERAAALWGGARQQVEAASSEAAAARQVRAEQPLPGEALVDVLRARYPSPEGSPALHLSRARAALWDGRFDRLEAALEDARMAVSAAPDDPEALAALVEVGAALWPLDPDRIALAHQVMDRAFVLAPGSVAVARARGFLAWRTGDVEAAREAAAACPAEDPGCALLRGIVDRDPDALAALAARFPGRLPVELARGDVALALGRPDAALRIARALARSHPGEPLVERLRAMAALAAGEPGDAREAAGRAARARPDDVEIRHVHGKLLLVSGGDPARALDELAGAAERGTAGGYADLGALLADASAAALAAGEVQRAVELGERARQAAPGLPAAHLQLARALLAAGEPRRADAALGAAEVAGIRAMEAARFHVGAARVYRAFGELQQAERELVAARDAAPRWPPVHLESAALRWALGDPAGAVDAVLAVPFQDIELDRTAPPMDRLWVPPPRWDGFARQVRRGLETDPRLAGRLAEVAAVLAWVDGDPAAGALLRRAAEGGPAEAARAALAWEAVRADRPAEALARADEVLAARPGEPLVLAIRGWALARLGRAEEADDALLHAVQEGGGVAGVHRLVGMAREAMGDREAARAAWRRVAELAPGDSEAALALERLAGAG